MFLAIISFYVVNALKINHKIQYKYINNRAKRHNYLSANAQ